MERKMGQTAEDIRDNIVKIADENGNCVGTGFFIENKEYCVTCHHNIWQLDEIYIEREVFRVGREQQSKLRYHAEWVEEFSDMQKDVAFLKVQGADFKPLRYRMETYGKIPVKVRGFSLQDLRHFPTGKEEGGELTNIDDIFHWDEEEIRVLEDEGKEKKWHRKPEVNVPVYAFKGNFSLGFSGAPVCYEHDWKVVGMFEAKDDNQGYIIPMNIVIEKFDVSEFAKAKRGTPKWSSELDQNHTDARRTDISGSYVGYLVKHILEETPTMDYATFNLGAGKEWLSSRLYLFTRILQKTHGLRCVVFVDMQNEIRDRFIGIAEANKVRYALARHYPWLEKAFARAYSDLEGLQNRSIFTSVKGSVNKQDAVDLVSEFLNQPEIQYSPDSPKPNQQVPNDLNGQWVKLGSNEKWEHAEWLDTKKVEDEILKDVPYRRSKVKRSWRIGKSLRDRFNYLLSFEGPFIAVLEDDNETFEELYDRQRYVEEAAYLLISKEEE